MKAPLWDYVEALGIDGDTAFADLVEATFDQVEKDRKAADAEAKSKGKGKK